MSALWEIRILGSQCFAALPLNILRFTCGSFVGLTLVLSSPQEEIYMSSVQNSLFVNHCYAQPLGYILGGVLAQIFGSRKVFMAADIIFICSWLLFRSTSTVEMLLCAQSIIGFTTGMIEGPSYTFMAEITQPLFRNTLMAALDLSFLAGTLFFFLMTNAMHWKTIALVNLIFPIFGISLMFFIPESPYWLANKNRYERVAKSLSWFRGWKLSDSVKAESYLIINHAKKTPTMLKLFLQKSFYIPLIIVFFTLLVDTSGGSQILLLNLDKVMKELKSPINKPTTAIIIMSGRTICAIVCMLSIHIAGKRLLVFVSVIAGSIFLVISSIFAFLIFENQVTAEAFFWIPSITVIISTFMLTAGIGNVSLILNSEIFPTKVRQISTGIGFFVRYVMLFILQIIFLRNFDSWTAPGTFMLLAFVNIIGFVILYYIFPETGNRCLIEIEGFYVGISKFKSNKFKQQQII